MYRGFEGSLFQEKSSCSGFRRPSAETTWPDMPLALSLRSVLGGDDTVTLLVVEPLDGAALAVRCGGIRVDMSVWLVYWWWMMGERISGVMKPYPFSSLCRPGGQKARRPFSCKCVGGGCGDVGVLVA
jgi:hypothetical protein